MNKIRALRVQYCALFLMIHFFSFFHHTLASIVQDDVWIFNFVKMSCCWNLVGQDYSQHLSEFLTFKLLNFIFHLSFIIYFASSILMNVYSFKMHWFNLLLMFHIMYKLSCFTALEQGGHSAHLREQQCWQIECKFAAFFDDLKATNESSFNTYIKNIKM